MSSKKEIMGNIMHILLAAFISTGAGLLTGFLIPKFYTLENYAFYKTFALYLGYVGLVHLGFADGFFVQFGALDFEELPKKTVRALIRVFLVWHVVLSLILAFLLMQTNMPVDRKICFLFVCFNITIVNCNNLFSFINQSTKRFKWDSKLKNIQSFLSLAAAFVVIVVRLESYIYYISFITAIYLIVFVGHVFKNRELILGECAPLSETWQLTKKIVKVGFFIMLSQLMGEVILGFDRLLIDNFMPQTAFAIYSFAVSIISILYGVINSLSKIVYPYLARADRGKLGEYYRILSMVIAFVAGLSMNALFVVGWIVEYFLPNYMESMKVLIFLLPTLIFKILISFLGSNYFKLLGMEKQFSINNFIALFLAVTTDVVALVIFGNVVSIAVASLISFVLWYVITHVVITKKVALKLKDVLIGMAFPVLMVMAIIACSNYGFIGMVVYNVLIIIMIVVLFRKDVMNIPAAIRLRK